MGLGIIFLVAGIILLISFVALFLASKKLSNQEVIFFTVVFTVGMNLAILGLWGHFWLEPLLKSL